MPEPVLKQLDGRLVFAGYKGPGCSDWIASTVVAIQSPKPGLRIIVWSHDDECRTSNFRRLDQPNRGCRTGLAICRSTPASSVSPGMSEGILSVKHLISDYLMSCGQGPCFGPLVQHPSQRMVEASRQEYCLAKRSG